MKIVLASNNKHKIGELHAILSSELGGDLEILSLSDIGFEGDIIEDGQSFEENAMIKARAVSALGYIGVGDDSGLSVDALDGAPGIYSARYAGDHNDAANNEALLQRLAGVPQEERGAAFVCCIACVFPDGRELTVRGEARGRMLEDYHGAGGFGYDPLFYYEPLDKTFAELSAEEKNAVSHRGQAIAAFADSLKKELR